MKLIRVFLIRAFLIRAFLIRAATHRQSCCCFSHSCSVELLCPPVPTCSIYTPGKSPDLPQTRACSKALPH